MSKKFVFVVDFTWDSDRQAQPLVILEMGDYFKSSLTGLDFLRSEEGHKAVDEEIALAIKQDHPNAIYLKDELLVDAGFQMKQVEISDIKNDETACYHIQAPELLISLLIHRAQNPSIETCELIASFSGLKPSIEQQKQLEFLLKENENNVDILNFPSGGLFNACCDKVVFYNFCRDSALIPDTLIIDLNAIDNEALKRFVEQNHLNDFIVKPTNKSRGLGVRLVKHEELMSFISGLSMKARGQKNSTKDDYWSYASDSFIVIQKFSPSKTINFQGQEYLPTGRAVIQASFQQDDSPPVLSFIGGYWKLPNTSAKDLSTHSVVSDIGDSTPRVARIDLDDWLAITSYLEKEFAPLLGQMFKTTTDELVNSFGQSNNLALKAYGKFEFSRFSYLPPLAKDNTEKELNYLQEVRRYFSLLSYGSPNSMKLLDCFRDKLTPVNRLKTKVEQSDSKADESLPSILAVKESAHQTRDTNKTKTTKLKLFDNAVSADADDYTSLPSLNCQLF